MLWPVVVMAAMRDSFLLYVPVFELNCETCIYKLCLHYGSQIEYDLEYMNWMWCKGIILLTLSIYVPGLKYAWEKGNRELIVCRIWLNMVICTIWFYVYEHFKNGKKKAVSMTLHEMSSNEDVYSHCFVLVKWTFYGKLKKIGMKRILY